jgi:hypothetical protein
VPVPDQHCPGCRGFTRDFVSECPGIAPHGTAAVLQQYVPHLRWRDRLKVLLGRQVALSAPVFPLAGPAKIIRG